MKVTVAIDSFKGSLSSIEAGNAVKEGILRINPDAKVAVLPVADGGEGTVEALIQGLGGRYVTVPVKDPLGNEITAGYGLIENNGQTQQPRQTLRQLMEQLLHNFSDNRIKRFFIRSSTTAVGRISSDCQMKARKSCEWCVEHGEW